MHSAAGLRAIFETIEKCQNAHQLRLFVLQRKFNVIPRRINVSHSLKCKIKKIEHFKRNDKILRIFLRLDYTRKDS